MFKCLLNIDGLVIKLMFSVREVFRLCGEFGSLKGRNDIFLSPFFSVCELLFFLGGVDPNNIALSPGGL